MPEKPGSVLYNETAIWAKIVAWLALGIGGLVCVPTGLYGLNWWLLVLAVPLLLLGLVLLQTRLHMAVERETGDVVVTNRLLGLKIHTRRYPWSDVMRLELQRVAGDERERPSDTWYLRLQLGLDTFTIGRYDSRVSALRAQRDVAEALKDHPNLRTGMRA